jgi:hypothetical protein
MAAHYLLPLGPADSRRQGALLPAGKALLPAATLLVAGGWPAWSLALLALVSSGALLAGRRWLSPRGFRAESELAGNTLFVAGAAVLVGTAGLESYRALALDLPAGRLAAISLVAAGICFLLRGAAEVVRGILEKAESIPLATTPPGSQAIVREFNRGRLIGYLERLLIMAIVMASQFAALGVLVAAKGLIRSRELDRHEFAEYFLIGTLASITVAFFVGLGLRALVLPLW